MDAKRAQGIGLSAVMGAAAGAALAAHRGPKAAAKGALAGAAVLAAVDAAARAVQQPDEIPAVWSRITASGALAAPVGWVAGKAGASPLAVGVAAGAVAGAMGIRPQKVVLGPVVRARGRRGAARAAAGGRCAAASVLTFRTVSPLVFRDPQVSLLADRVPAPRTAVRGAARGTDPVRRHRLRPRPRRATGGVHRDAPDVGIVASLDAAGRTGVRPGGGGPARARVLRAHHPVHAGHRARLAALGPPRLPAVPHAGRAPAGAGQHADEPARGTARRSAAASTP